MASWIYFFSKFTDEAIVFEMLAFFFLMSIYAAYWLMKKRAMKDGDRLIPLSALRGYLDKNIIETNEFRMALFGEALKVADPGTASTGNFVTPTDPNAQKTVETLQAQLTQQMLLIEELKNQKLKIEAQVAAGAAAAPADGAAPAAGNSADTDELRKKLKLAEDRLAEYSVIEDDLANLKRLQQENAKLKAQLGGGGATAATAAAPATPAPAAAPEVPAAAPVAAKAPAPAPAAAAPAAEPAPEMPAFEEAPPPVEASEAAPELAPPAETKDTAGDPSQQGSNQDTTAQVAAPEVADFEKVVDQVEEKLKTEPPTAAVAAAPQMDAAPADKAPSTAAEIPAKTKNDEDLLAEFEKMLGN